MSLNNPVSSPIGGGLANPSIGTTFLGNIPSIPLVSTRNFFLQQMETWVSSPANTTQWIVLFDSFPKSLTKEVMQELEPHVGDKTAWNVPLKQMTNYAFQKTIGCVFCQGVELPRERVEHTYIDPNRGFLGGPVSNKLGATRAIKLDFLETNLSFTDGILRPWVKLVGHKGLVARPEGEEVTTTMTVIQYGRTNQYLSPIPRKVWTFWNVAPMSIGATSHKYTGENVEIRTGIEFTYSRYQMYNSTYVPLFSLIDKFSNGGIKELTDTILVDDSVKNLGKLF